MSTNTIKPAATKAGAATAAARILRPGAAKGSSKKTRNLIIAGVLALLVIIPSSVWAVIHFRHTAKIQKAKDMRSQALAGIETKTPEQQRQTRDELRSQLDSLGLSEAEKQETRSEERAKWEQNRRDFEAKIDNYVAMSATERAAFMRKKVAEDAKHFDDQAAKDKNSSASGSSSSSGQGDSGSSKWRGMNNTTGESSAERRSDGRKRMLDNTSPAQRAKFTMYMQDLTRATGDQNAIRSQQGLPALPVPGMGGGRGGRGFGR